MDGLQAIGRKEAVGASGQELGAASIVALHSIVGQTGQGFVITCFVLGVIQANLARCGS